MTAGNDLQELGLEVLGVSYDSPEKNRKFAEKNDLPFLLLSDSDRTLAKSVGASRALLPYAKRVSYLVDADGIVLEIYPGCGSEDPRRGGVGGLSGALGH